MKVLTQKELAYQEGYTECFLFGEGQVHCVISPENCYPIVAIEKQPYPCLITQTIVYRITTPDGIKGIAILDFYHAEDNQF